MKYKKPDRRRFNGKHTKGEGNPNSKLTWEIVRNIRKEYPERRMKYDKITYKQIAEVHHVSRHAISDIINKRTWIDKL